VKDSPDALSAEVDYKFLKEKLSKKRTNIKTFIMDQNIIRGIGNAYADEILWKSKIHPESVCNKIPDNKIKELAKNIKSVLKYAEKQILKINPDIISGEDRSFLKIHNSKKKESPTGAKIHSKMLSSRITYYTDEQKLYK
jgi:formamidopyrimidine-DNA glycosylase